ncbi:MAG: hypothetical protein PCFJNLEI_01649 [Verrucomicrobiae bacterium]|nr:hypothetical protein [Verrucomicrobiae bacterium]
MARPPQRQQRLFKELQHRIQCGEFAPGSRIPARHELVKSYRVSPVTVQRVFDRLIEEGYVEPRGRSGSFVADAPPHLNNYWIIFPHESKDAVSPFRLALTREAQKFARKGQAKFSIHVGHGGNFRHGDYEKLLHDVTTHRTAGIIFATAAGHWDETPLRKEAGLPRVAFSHGPDGPADIALVRFDRTSFFELALDRLKALDRSRVALLACTLPAAYRELFLQGLAQRGMETRPHWTQFVHPHGAAAAHNVMQLLLNPDQKTRPDALLVLDDVLLEHATTGVRDAGVRVPEELTVIAHANFPHPVMATVPVVHLGYDMTGLLERCVAVLTAQRQNESFSHVTLAPAVFADEPVAVGNPVTR